MMTRSVFWSLALVGLFACGGGGDKTDDPCTEGTDTEATDTDPGTDPGTDTGTDPGIETDPGTDTGTDPGTETDPDTDTGTDPGAETDPDTDMGTDPGTDTDPDTDPGTDTDPGPGTDTDLGTGTDLGTDSDPDTETPVVVIEDAIGVWAVTTVSGGLCPGDQTSDGEFVITSDTDSTLSVSFAVDSSPFAQVFTFTCDAAVDGADIALNCNEVHPYSASSCRLEAAFEAPMMITGDAGTGQAAFSITSVSPGVCVFLECSSTWSFTLERQ